jgi:hypothetical protein
MDGLEQLEVRGKELSAALKILSDYFQSQLQPSQLDLRFADSLQCTI